MKNRIRKCLPWAAQFLLMMLLSLYIENRGDDFRFQEGIEVYGSLLGWARWFGANWGGRIIPQGILVLLLQLPSFVYAAVNAGMLVLLNLYAGKILGLSGRNAALTGFLLPVLTWLLIPLGILQEPLLWKSATVLYAWGTVTFFAAIQPWLLELGKGERPGTGTWLASLAGILYTSSFEQMAALLAGFALSAHVFGLIMKRKASARLWIYTLLAIGLTVFFALVLPGNRVRTEEETIAWYSFFGMYSLPEKLLLGLNYTVGSLENEMLPVILLLCGSLLLPGREKEHPDSWLLQGLRWGVFLYFAVCAIDRLGSSAGHEIEAVSGIYRLFSPREIIFRIPGRTILLNVIHYLAYIALGILCTVQPGKPENRFMNFMLYFGGMGTAVMMGFSPTLIVSEGRARFICYFFLVMVLVKVVLEKTETEMAAARRQVES